MSLRIDTTEWITDSLIIGETGGGVLAENVATTGTDGDGYLANDVSLPGDNGKEICGRIISVPAGLTFFAYEDGSTIATAEDAGIYTVPYQLYVDYVATGPETDIVYIFGDGILAGLDWTEDNDAMVTVVVSGTTSDYHFKRGRRPRTRIY